MIAQSPPALDSVPRARIAAPPAVSDAAGIAARRRPAPAWKATHPFLPSDSGNREHARQQCTRAALILLAALVAMASVLRETPAPLPAVVRAIMLAAVLTGALFPDRDVLGWRRQRAIGVLYFAAFIGDTQLVMAAAVTWALARVAVAREESLWLRLANGAALVIGTSALVAAVTRVAPAGGALLLPVGLSAGPPWAIVLRQLAGAAVAGLAYAAAVSLLALLDRLAAGERRLARRLGNWVRHVWPAQAFVAVQAMVALFVCELIADRVAGLILAGVFFLAVAAYYFVTSRRRAADLRLLGAFGDLVDGKDAYTAHHSGAVAVYAAALADRLGLSPRDAARVAFAAQLHDVGKIGVPDDILGFPGRLDPAQFAAIERHPVLGGQAIGQVQGLAWAARLIRAHHERPDGKGYPDGLTEAQIPLLARILSVADAYDALTSERAYRAALAPREALRILRAGAGTQWWAPAVVVLGEAIEAAPPGETVPLSARPNRIDAFA